ncbi:MAG: reverse transcriptase family protein, partial [Pirellulales bacterium]
MVLSQHSDCPIVSTRTELAAVLATTTGQIASFVDNTQGWYTRFEIPKSNSEPRVIEPPRNRLRVVQRILLKSLYSRVRMPSYLHGGLPKRSCITHARGHVGRAMVATLDVKSFFPSTNLSHIRPVYERLGFSNEALDDVIAMTMLRGALPQGAPTSCLLANLAFAPTDAAIIRLICRRHLSYTRYVDDIAISGDANFRELRGPLVDRIRDSGYEVANHKIHFMDASERQIVTGLVVNAKLRPTAEFTTAIKNDIRLCAHVGPLTLADLQGVRPGTIRARLNGRIAHVQATDPKRGKRLKGMMCSISWSRPRKRGTAGGSRAPS